MTTVLNLCRVNGRPFSGFQNARYGDSVYEIAPNYRLCVGYYFRYNDNDELLCIVRSVGIQAKNRPGFPPAEYHTIDPYLSSYREMIIPSIEAKWPSRRIWLIPFLLFALLPIALFQFHQQGWRVSWLDVCLITTLLGAVTYPIYYCIQYATDFGLGMSPRDAWQMLLAYWWQHSLLSASVVMIASGTTIWLTRSYFRRRSRLQSVRRKVGRRICNETLNWIDARNASRD